MGDHIPKLVVNITKDCCRNYMTKLVDFCVTHCGMAASKSINRVQLKKSLLSTTKGDSLPNFVKFLSMNKKLDLKNLCLMECPVACPTKKRHVERDPADLGDLSSILIGVYTMCKLVIEESELINPSYALKELGSVTSILDQLNEYYKQHPRNTEIPRGDDVACNRELKRLEQKKRAYKLERLKEQIFNIPKDFNIEPGDHAYVTGKQYQLLKAVNKNSVKKKSKEDYIWISDIADDTLDDNLDNKSLCKINKIKLKVDDQICEQVHTQEQRVPERIENLQGHNINFRMKYDIPIGNEVKLVRFDIFKNKYIQGININNNGRTRIDLSLNVDDEEIDANEPFQGLEMYRPVSPQKAAYFQSFINNIPTHPNSLSFLKRVPYNYKCQSSGDVYKSPEETIKQDIQDFTEISKAIEST
ncbi:hypothetical protein BdWA1_002976 [Babesia duncani]|uniref:Uncharacterized protein n=1 Tax=Babesia duncani TaxID=323732 RepID=A0AAD9PIC0_9APIC|nr:hypothetical protein BdWA1_002976 [Babesia duncani]